VVTVPEFVPGNVDASAMLNPNDVIKAAELIAGADALVIGAGAGMGVDSGLPDFRGKDGFWQAYPALGREQVDFYSIANPKAFHDQPNRAWGFYGHRLNLYRATKPHAGFQILKRWGELMPRGHRVFTSNVDGQFQKAGFEQTLVHECHGSIHHLQCLGECGSGVWDAQDFEPLVDAENCQLLNTAPVCPKCGGLARPNVMMFGDWNWEAGRSAAQRRGEEQWLQSIGYNERVVVVEIGAGTAIPSVREFSHRVIHEFSGRLVRINPREFSVPSTHDVGLASGAVAALTAIDLTIRASDV
jgi:NAD-dependent SIR2 family protein deacetylase